MVRKSLILLLFVALPVQAATIGQYMSNKEAVSSYEQEDYDYALEGFSEALSKGDDLGEIHSNIGNVYFKKKDYENAIVAYEKAISKLKGEARLNAIYNLGTSYFAKGDLEKAKETYTSLLREEPNHVSGKKNLEAVLTILKAQQHRNQQEQEKEQKEKKKEQKEREKPKSQSQPQQQNKEQKKKEEKKQNAKQLLNMLSEKEKEARKKHKQLPDQEVFVEKDW